MDRFVRVRRVVCALVALALLHQSSGVALAAGTSMALPRLSLRMEIAAALQSLQNTQVGALLSGNEARWDAMHAPPPVFHREAPPIVVPPPRFVRHEGILNHGVFRAGPPMLNRRLRPDEVIKDPRAIHHGTVNPSPCLALATHTRCAQNAVSLGGPLSTFTAQTFNPQQFGSSGIRTMSVTPTVQPFQYEADTTSAPSTVVYTGGIESGALSRTMDSAPANASTSQTLSYTAANTLVSFAWVSPANVPNSTSWAARNYTVSLNITQANPNIEITAVRVLRVDSTGGGGGGDEGLAEVGGLTNLTQTLANTGMLTFTIAGGAQTASASDRVAVKIVVKSTASGTQTFSYLAGQNSGSGVNVVQPYSLQADTIAGPTSVVYTNNGIETGALSRIMDSVSTNTAADQQLTYSGSSGSVSFAWVSQPTFPNSTSWPAQTYTVTLNITQPNSHITITAVRLLRVDSTGGGGGGDEGLALVGGLTNLSQSLGNAGILTFTISGTAQTASATDRLAVKIVLNNSATTTQSFAYSAGQNSGSGVNLPAQGVLSGSTTGINRWWTYEEGALPGQGKYMVNVGNGNLLVQADDVDIPERGIDLAFRRTYNAQSTHDSNNTDASVPSNYGDGWSNTFDAHLAYDGANTISVYDIDGARYDYTADGNGNWVHPAGQYASLMWDGQCGYQWTKKTGTTYYFYSPDLNAAPSCGLSTVGGFPHNSAYGGRLYKIWARNSNNYIAFSYAWANNDASSAANLSQMTVTHADGQALTLTFGKQISGGPTELLSITRPDGQVLTYQYDSTSGSTLQAVTLPGNNVAQVTESYLYNANHQLAWTASPRYNASTADGDVTYFNYDSSNRVTRTYDYGVVNFQPGTGPFPSDGINTMLQGGMPSGLQTWRINNFSGYGSAATSMSDSNGHSTIWTVDSLARVTQTQAYTGESTPTYLITSESWDSNNNLTETVDARGNATDYAYDSNGNTTSVAQPSVATSEGTLRPTSLYSYDSSNNILAYCDPVETHSLGKDWTANPGTSDTLCPSQSGATRYTWKRYIAGIDTSGDPNEPYGYLSDTYTPLGYHLSLTYNTETEGGIDAGLPTQVQGASYTQIDNTTRQPTQTFAYNSYGDLTSYNKGNGAWTLAYDTSNNRLTSATDPDNITTRTCYFNNGQVKATQTALQYQMDSGLACGPHSTLYTYDADGDVVTGTNHVNNAADTTSKWYDGADRLVEVQLPYDSSHDAFQNAWTTRYIYDLTQGATVTLSGTSSVSYKAYGNLYKIQEALMPGTNQNATWYSGAAKLANTQFQDTKGTAFDALDRAVVKYQFDGDLPHGETETYDASGYYGEATGHCNYANQCSSITYYATGAVDDITYSDATPSETTTYDPDGRTASVQSSAFGTQIYNYDSDGHVTSEIEPSGGGVTSPATLTYHYYADGMRSALDVSASALNQTSLFAYAYRTDGEITTQQINYNADAKVGNSALQFTYTSAGKLMQRTETGPAANPNAITFTYDASTGAMNKVVYPAATLDTFSYDAAGELDSYYQNITGGVTNGDTSVGTFTYTNRGELAQDPRAQGSANFANGAQLAGTNSGHQATWDARNALLQSFANPYLTDGSAVNFAFDGAGRQTTSDESGTDHYGNTYDITNARTYDAESRVLSSAQSAPWDLYQSVNHIDNTLTSYQWGPNNEPIRIGSTPAVQNAQPSTSQLAYDTLHWDGGQLLFTTNSAGQVDDIKVGAMGDITPLDSSYSGLTFYDRVAGAIAFCHNATGAAGNDKLNAQHSKLFGTDPSTSPCKIYGTQVMSSPTSVVWGSQNIAGGVGQGKVLGTPGGDGITDGANTIQGDRSYDSVQGQWTTPDPYAGDVRDPMSQKSYVWNNNNPVGYSDPSGFAGCPNSPMIACNLWDLIKDGPVMMLIRALNAGQVYVSDYIIGKQYQVDPYKLGPGEVKVSSLLPKRGSEQEQRDQNEAAIRALAIERNARFKDLNSDPKTGALIPDSDKNSYLNLERDTLQSLGYHYDAATHEWWSPMDWDQHVSDMLNGTSSANVGTVVVVGPIPAPAPL